MNNALKIQRRLMALRKLAQLVIISAAAVALPAAAAAQDTAPDYVKPPAPHAAATAAAATPSQQSAALDDQFQKQQRRLRESRQAHSPLARALAQVNGELDKARFDRSTRIAERGKILADYNDRIRGIASQGGSDEDQLWLAAQAASAKEAADAGVGSLEKRIKELEMRRGELEKALNRDRMRSSLPDAVVPPSFSDSSLVDLAPPEPEPLSDAERARALDYLKGLGAP